MFPARYFPARYFASRYWPNVGATSFDRFQTASITKLIELSAGDTIAVYGKLTDGSSADFISDGSRITITGPLGG